MYKYRVPGDVLYAWKIYPDKRDYTSYGDYYYATRTYVYYTFPLQTGSGLIDSVGEFIGGEIHSDYAQLYLFYTKSGKIKPSGFTQQFVTLLINALELDLRKSKDDDTDKLELISKLHARDAVSYTHLPSPRDS